MRLVFLKGEESLGHEFDAALMLLTDFSCFRKT